MDRVLPTPGKPGPVTAMAHLEAGEIGSEALTRIGGAVMPDVKGKGKGGRPSKIARQLAAIVACRTEGMSDQKIADALNMSVSTVRSILHKARRQNSLSDIIDRVENRAVPQAVDNLIEFLDDKDREFTMATLKGVGVFRSHSAQKVDATTTDSKTLRVEIVMPDFSNGQAPQVAVGSIVANPRKGLPQPVIDAEVA